MALILYILFGITLFQDVKYRGVHWFVFPLLIVGTVLYRDGQMEWQQMGYNLAFVIVLLSSLTLYLTLKQGTLIVITQGYFSWGDILFLLALIPLFDVRTYMFYFIIGTIGSLLIHIAASRFQSQKSVPYAGYMSIFGSVFIAFQSPIHELLNHF